jgi:flagellar biosynthetic protein FliR
MMSVNVEWLWGFIVVFARTSALVSLAPVFGSKNVPVSVRVGLSFAIALGLSPVVQAYAGTPPPDLILFILKIGYEVLVGLVMGYVVNLVLMAVMIAGEVLDFMMGLSVMQVLNPVSAFPTTLLAQFHYMLALVLFAMIDGHHLLLQGLLKSFEIGGGTHDLVQTAQAGLTSIGTLITQMMMLACQIAAPAAGILLIVDAALAIVSRAVPQTPVWLIGMPAKIAIGLTAIAFSLPMLVWAAMRLSEWTIRAMELVMRMMR